METAVDLLKTMVNFLLFSFSGLKIGKPHQEFSGFCSFWIKFFGFQIKCFVKQTEQIGTNRLTEGISFGFLSILINSKTLPQVIVMWEDNAN